MVGGWTSPSLIAAITWIAGTGQRVMRCSTVSCPAVPRMGRESRLSNGHQGFNRGEKASRIVGHWDALTGMGKEVTQRQLKANEQASQSVLGQCHALVDQRTGAGHKEPEAVRVCGDGKRWGKLRQRPKGTASVCKLGDPLALNAATAAGDANKKPSRPFRSMSCSL